MKGILKAITVLMACAALLAGCSSPADQGKEIDIETVASDMVAATEFDEELVKVSESYAGNHYDLTGVEASVIYRNASGGKAEELSLFKAKDADSVQTIRTMLEKHLENQKTAFENYVPAEIYKLDNAVLTENGNYVALVVASDGSSAEAVFDKAFE